MRYKTIATFILHVLFVGFIQQANAKGITIATWNMGWHLSNVEANHWIRECDSSFSENEFGIWQKSLKGQKAGWELQWGRDAPIQWNIKNIPPCDVYRNNKEIIRVSLAAYKNRASRIAKFIRGELQADVIAFQEVSGEQSIKDILPDNGDDYKICSYRGYSIQRLAFAWKKSLKAEGNCAVYKPLALNALSSLRPGLHLTLNFAEETISFLNVHLKSSCVSFLESSDSNGKGQLSGSDHACTILQQQIEPLKYWSNKTLLKNKNVILLGDFNRNLWHEYHAVKGTIRPYENKVNNLWQEVNDDKNKSEKLRLLDEQCNITTEAKFLCKESKKRLLTKKEKSYLSSSSVLGCRNSIGVDHIVVAHTIKVKDVPEILSISVPEHSTNIDNIKDEILPLSDHCPYRVKIDF